MGAGAARGADNAGRRPAEGGWPLPFAAAEPGEFAVDFAFDGAGFEVLAAVAEFLAFGDAEFEFDVAAVPVKAECHEGAALGVGEGEEAEDFAVVEEEAAGAFGVVLFVAGAFVGLDIGAVEEDPGVFDAGEGAADIDEAVPDRLDLGAFQLEAGLEPLENVVVVKGPPVGGDIGQVRIGSPCRG